MDKAQAGAVRDARLVMRWTQAHLAQAACVSLSTVKRMERGAPVTGENLRAVCAVLGIDVAALPLRPDPGPGEAPGPEALGGEYVDLGPEARAAIAGLGPVIAAGRCRGDLWLGQAGRAASREAHERNQVRLLLPAALSSLAAVAGLACLALYLGYWVGFLNRDGSGAVILALAVPTLACAAFLIGCAAVLLPAEMAERALVGGMSGALARVGAATEAAYVGFVEAEGDAAVEVIPWAVATVRAVSDGGAVTLVVEGGGRCHEVPGLPGDSPLVVEALARAARSLRVAAPAPAPGPGRWANPFRPRPVDYVTRLAPGHARTRVGDAVTVRGPGREVLATVVLSEEGVEILSRETLALVMRGRGVRRRIEPGVPCRVRLATWQPFFLVRGEPDPGGWKDVARCEDIPGFVMSASHFVDPDAAPVELALRHVGGLAPMGMAVAAVGLTLAAAALQADLIVSERATRANQAAGMGPVAAHVAASPILRLLGAPPVVETDR